jgi:hypothetical protein
MTFKVGDKVRTTREELEGVKLFPVGTVGVVLSVCDDDTEKYRVWANEDYWWYSEGMLELCEEKTYEKGLADAWELAKKIQYSLTSAQIEEIFGMEDDAQVMNTYTPQEALAKIEAYEREKEIKPTDIVEYNGKNWVVTEVYKGEYSIWNGKKVIHTANVKKVGSAESIEPLAELLRQIGE